MTFKNWSQYNAYGQLLFDIQTDNGGMYIEGIPSKPNNQATFFAYRQFWIAPEFAIWNLNHEYVHYYLQENGEEPSSDHIRFEVENEKTEHENKSVHSTIVLANIQA